VDKPNKITPWIVLEFALVALWFTSDIRHWHYHLVPLSKTIDIVALAWISLRLRGLRWRDVGLCRPLSWPRTLAIGVCAGVAMEALELFVTQPLLQRITHKLPDLSELHDIVGNWKMLLLALALTWTLAAFGEEMAYRGYLLNRMADVVGRSRAGWAAALVAMSVVFGLAHYYQGATGMIENAIDGFILGALYLRFGRNLWIPILAHGITDTADVLIIFAGKYPGLH